MALASGGAGTARDETLVCSAVCTPSPEAKAPRLPP